MLGLLPRKAQKTLRSVTQATSFRWGPPSREKLGQDINTSVFADEDEIVTPPRWAVCRSSIQPRVASRCSGITLLIVTV